MEQDTIIVKMNFCVNPLLAEHLHIGGEFSIREGQTREEAWEEGIGRVEAFFKNRYPQLEKPPTVVPDKQVEKPTPKDNMITAITTCTEVATLETFRKLAASKPEFQKAFDNRLKELQP